MVKSHRKAASLYGAVLIALMPCRVAAEWIEVRSPHFLVVSDAGERRARDLAWEFEQARNAILQLWPGAKADSSVDVVVFGAKDQQSLKTLAPQFFEVSAATHPDTVFTTSPYAQFIALRMDTNADPRRGPVNAVLTAYIHYAAVVFGSTLDEDSRLWLLRGLSQVLSNIIVRDNHVIVGAAIPWNVQQLRAGGTPTFDELLEADRTSPYFTDVSRTSAFDAGAWALVHFMMFGNEGKHLPLFHRFAESLAKGTDASWALLRNYGERETLKQALSRHISDSGFAEQRLSIDTRVDLTAFQARTLTPANAALHLARLYAAMHRAIEAREQLRAAGAAPAAGEVEGILLENEGKTAEAIAAYGRASDAQAATFYGEFRLAMLPNWPDLNAADRRERLEAIMRRLLRSTTLNPRFAPAQAHYALALAQLARLDEAQRAAERAAALEPRDFASNLALSQVFWVFARRDEAKTAAAAALRLAADDEDRARAEGLLDVYARASNDPPAFDAQQLRDMEACEKKDMAACGRLMTFAEQNCLNGKLGDCVIAAHARSEGWGLSRDPEKAMKYLEKPCENDIFEACTLLATLQAAKQQKADLARARALLDKTCKRGYARACELLKDW